MGQLPVLYGVATTSIVFGTGPHITPIHKINKESSKGANPTHHRIYSLPHQAKKGEVNHLGSQTLSPQEQHKPCTSVSWPTLET